VGSPSRPGSQIKRCTSRERQVQVPRDRREEHSVRQPGGWAVPHLPRKALVSMPSDMTLNTSRRVDDDFVQVSTHP
jgi:hypothetical protein